MRDKKLKIWRALNKLQNAGFIELDRKENGRTTISLTLFDRLMEEWSRNRSDPIFDRLMAERVGIPVNDNFR